MFNEEISFIMDYFTGESEVRFTSNNTVFQKMSFNEGMYEICYWPGVSLSADIVQVYAKIGGDGWVDETYRTVDFGLEPQNVEVDFWNWFTSNAAKISN